MEHKTKVMQVRLTGIGNTTEADRLQGYIEKHETEGWQAVRSSIGTYTSEDGSQAVIAIVHFQRDWPEVE